MASRQLPQDWQDRSAYRPVLLETFVETQRFTGACYKAANWIHVGQTQGRGKLDRDHKADLPTKKHLALPPEQTLPKIASLHLSPHAHLPLVIARLWVHRIFTVERRLSDTIQIPRECGEAVVASSRAMPWLTNPPNLADSEGHLHVRL